MVEVNLKKVYKIYPDGKSGIKKLDLTIKDGEFLVLVGPSGCGKSTLLRMLAGLEEITGGTLEINGNKVNDQSPQERDIAMVFQNYALYPHLTVKENIEVPLKIKKKPPSEIDDRVQDALENLELTDLVDRKPKQLSGGQQQRVAMARAIVREPQVLLMDEPLSNLDAKMRVEIRTKISQLQKKTGLTTVYVTHDQVEAMTLGDRVAVLNKGELKQDASPQTLYSQPANVFVADFIGSPAMNLFETTLSKNEQGETGINFPNHDQFCCLDPDTIKKYDNLEQYFKEGKSSYKIIVGLRPEAFYVAENIQDNFLKWEIMVDVIEDLGHEKILYFKTPFERYQLPKEKQDKNNTEKEKKSFWGKILPFLSSEQNIQPDLEEDEAKQTKNDFTARLTSRSWIQPNSKLVLGVDLSQLYLFWADGETFKYAPSSPGL